MVLNMELRKTTGDLIRDLPTFLPLRKKETLIFEVKLDFTLEFQNVSNTL